MKIRALSCMNFSMINKEKSLYKSHLYLAAFLEKNKTIPVENECVPVPISL